MIRMRKKPVWKVVARLGKSLVSASESLLPYGWSRVYQRSRRGRFLIVDRSIAFDTLAGARAFARCLSFYIFRAECETARRQKKIVSLAVGARSGFEAFQARNGKRDGWTSMPAPLGTVYCHNLRLVKLIRGPEGTVT